MPKAQLRSLSIAVLVVIAIAIITYSKALLRLELVTLDRRFKLTGAQSHYTSGYSNIVIVAIDEESIKRLGKWPWDRGIHAKLIKILKQAGARVIVFDIFFTEPDKSHPEADDKLAQAIKQCFLDHLLPPLPYAGASQRFTTVCG